MESKTQLEQTDALDASVEIPCRGESGAKKSFVLEFDDRAAFHLVNFYEPESVGDLFFRWSEPVAMIRLDVPPSDYEISIETGSLRCGGLDFPFKIFWNDQPLEKKCIRLNGGRISFSIPRDSFIRNDEQRLTITCKPLNAEKGRRQLGLPVQWVKLVQTGSSDPEFANPTKSRSRFWNRKSAVPKFRKLLGLKAPSPLMPIWELKLPNSSTSLRGRTAEPVADSAPGSDLVIVSSVEINSRHGTGLLIQYMFKDFSQITTVSSQRCFHGDRVRSAKHFEVPFEDLDRSQVYELVLNWFKNAPPKRAFVVPYYKTELLVAIALSDIFGTEICLHIMDDQCIYEDEISGELLDEAMSKSNLIFVISPEMRSAYQRRFNYPIYILPPVVPESMMPDSVAQPVPSIIQQEAQPLRGMAKVLSRFSNKSQPSPVETPRGVIIGNIWNEKWLAKLQETVRESGHEVDWYSNNPDAILLSSQKDNLANSGIHLKQPLWGDDLVQELRRRPYAIMPSGMLGQDEERESLARLSLPSRVPFVMSVSNIPIIVLGSAETAAAKFVQRFDLGAVVDYEASQFKDAVNRVLEPEVCRDIKQRAKTLSATFSARNMNSWINESIDLNQPVDNRYEAIFSDQDSRSNDPVLFKRRSNWNKQDLWDVLQRLKRQGICPEQMVDVGSGDGSWSWAVSQIYPDARFVMIEPLLSRYGLQDRNQYQKSLNNYEVIEMTLCDKQGETEFGDQSSPINSLQTAGFHGLSTFARQSQEIDTLDHIAESRNLTTRSMLKIDARYAEHLIIAGAINYIRSHVDVVFLTVEVAPKNATAKTYAEFLTLMSTLGFRLIDESVAGRCPRTEILISKNLIFARQEIAEKRVAA